MDESSLDENYKVLIIWKFQQYLDETPGMITDRVDTAMGAVAYDFAKWSCIPEGTTRAVLRDYTRNPQKYRDALERNEGGRIVAPKGGTYKLGDLTAAMNKLTRATSGSG